MKAVRALETLRALDRPIVRTQEAPAVSATRLTARLSSWSWPTVSERTTNPSNSPCGRSARGRSAAGVRRVDWDEAEPCRVHLSVGLSWPGLWIYSTQ